MEVVEQAPKAPSDGSGGDSQISSLLQSLQANKLQLQQQLQKLKKEAQQTEMAKKLLAVQAQKAKQQAKPLTETVPKREERKQEEKKQDEKKDDEKKDKERESKKRDRETRDRESKDSKDKDRHRDKERQSDSSRKRDRELRDRESKDKKEDRDKDRKRHKSESSSSRDHKRDKEQEKELQEKAKKLAERVKSGMSKLAVKKPEAEKFVPPPLLLDEKGRELDAKGNLLSIPVGTVATLKANLKLKNKKKKTPMTELLLQNAAAMEPKKVSTFFDPTLPAPKSDRRKRMLNFLEAGAIVKKAQKIRAKTEEPSKDLENNNAAVEVKDSVVHKEIVGLPKKPREPIPDVEWWDKYLLQGEYYVDVEKGEKQLNLSEIGPLIEHPIPIKPPGESEALPLPMYLTKQEQKKLRRRTRMEREKERQERVILGLEEPPKPKVKISNLMRVLGAEATADPTLIEQEVRRQIAERVANHEARNQAKKLTPEQKKEKKKKKHEHDLEKGTHVAVFRVKLLTDPRQKFKVDVNARDLGLTGCAILSKDCNMILVEGGAKSVRKFVKLLTKRMDWTKGVGETKESEDITIDNECTLLWQGIIMKPNFQQFRFETLGSDEAIRKYLNHRWSEHYWDMCLSYKTDKTE